MTSTSKFMATVSGATNREIDLLDAGVRESIIEFDRQMSTPYKGGGGDMPIKTGFLRASRRASTEEMAPIDPNAKGWGDDRIDANDSAAGAIGAVVAGMKIGDTLRTGFTAVYAPYMEAMFGFVRKTAQRWPQIMKEVFRKQDRRL